MEELEKQVIAYCRDSIKNYRVESWFSSFCRDSADQIFRHHLMEWSDDFCILHNTLINLYCKYTPAPTGKYVWKSVKIGSKFYPVEKWVEDRVQPAKPETIDLLQQFDAAVKEYYTK